MKPVAFPLAPMSPVIAVMTAALILLPAAFLAPAVAMRQWAFLVPAAVVLAIYAWIWLWFRPTRFELSAEWLDVVWPMRRERIPRASVAEVALIDRAELRRRVGWGMRVGAGGLWGGFGWLWTGRRGVVRMYISRLDRFVWIETGGRPWLITPAEPERFVDALSGRVSRIARP